MKETTDFEKITDFDNNPYLRKLLINYCLNNYEDNAILDDNHLLMEYNLLIEENRLNDLFLGEKLTNVLSDEENVLEKY